MERTSEEKALAGISHLGLFLSWWGLIGILAIYFVYRQKSAFVADQAKQALGVSILGTIIGLVGGGSVAATLFGALLSGNLGALAGAALLGLVLGVVGLALLVLVIIAAVNAFQGKQYTYPIWGGFVRGIGA